MEVDLRELAKFLVKAKKKTYAGNGKEIKPQRPGFKELEFKEGKWHYRDSYAGFFSAPGQEVVRFGGRPVWAMAYSGGMKEKYQGNAKFATEVFNFLKKALNKVGAAKPFRGPERFKTGDFLYLSKSKGGIKEFRGQERIYYKGRLVFQQEYIGGLIK